MRLWDNKDAKIIAAVINSVAPDSIRQRADLIVEAARLTMVSTTDLQAAIERRRGTWSETS